MRLHCKRINCVSGEEKWEWHDAVIKHSSVGWCIYLTPGVTGHESFIIHNFLRASREKSWTACAGTSGRWDTLVVPTEEVNRLVDVLELLPV